MAKWRRNKPTVKLAAAKVTAEKLGTAAKARWAGMSVRKRKERLAAMARGKALAAKQRGLVNGAAA